jgi:hypothetical protein
MNKLRFRFWLVCCVALCIVPLAGCGDDPATPVSETVQKQSSSGEPGPSAPTRKEREAARRERAQLRRERAQLRREKAQVRRARARARRVRAAARREARLEAEAIAAQKEQEQQEQEQAASCHPSYDPCLDPNASDYDCAGGSGDGPEYTGYVTVTGPDDYGLDSDGDGTGCES